MDEFPGTSAKSGNTRQCFGHLMNYVFSKLNQQQTEQFSQQFVRFMGVSREAAISWAKGETFPKGLHLFKLTYLLSFIGYDIPEYSNLSESLKNLGRLLVTKQLELDQFVSNLGLSENAELFRHLNNTRRPSEERAKKINQLLATIIPINITAVDILLADIKHGLNLDKLEDIKLSEPVITAKPDCLLALLNILQEITNCLTPQLEALLLDPQNSSSISSLRNEFKPGIFELSNNVFSLCKILNGLCSEKAKEIYLKESKK